MDNLLEQLSAQIHQAAHHAADEAVGSPIAINRTVGESMRHIGNLLMDHSTPYLPVRPTEVLVPPRRLNAQTLNAVVLINRKLRSQNGFLVMITSKGAGANRVIDLVGFREDPFYLDQTKFVTIPAEIGTELVRQANELINGEGLTLLQAVIVQDYFKAEEQRAAPAAPGAEELFSSDLSPETPEPTGLPEVAPVYDGKGLPTVSNDQLL